MATTLWGIIDGTLANGPTVLEPSVDIASGAALFSVADSGGAEVAVSFARNGLVGVEFYDEQGLPSAAQTPVTLGSVGMVLSEVEATASGVVGYAIGWGDAALGSSAAADLSAQYFGLAGPYGAPVSIGTGHGLQMGGYYVLDTQGKKPVADGFAAAWIDNGVVQFQRFAVWLDTAKDPIGTVQAAGIDGVPATPRPVTDPKSTEPANSGTDQPTGFGAGTASDLSLTVTHDGETVLAWSETVAGQSSIQLVAMNRNGSVNASVNAGGLPITVATGIPAGAEVQTAWLAGGGFVVAWSTADGVHAQMFPATGGTPGTGATFTPGAELTLYTAASGSFDGTFAISTMLDAIGKVPSKLPEAAV